MVKFLYLREKQITANAIKAKLQLNDFPPYKSMNVV